MNKHENNQNKEICQSDITEENLSAHREEAAAQAETLLDQVEAAQDHIRDLNNDISLLRTAENALDLITENLSKLRRLVMLKQHNNLSHSELNTLDDQISNLMMITMLIAEQTEYNGYQIFKDSIIRLEGGGLCELTLATSHLPEITGLETNDFHAVSDSLNAAARTINRQYKRIGTAMRILLDQHQQLCAEIDQMLLIQIHMQV